MNTGHPVNVSIPCAGCGNGCNTQTPFGKHARDYHLTVSQPCAKCHQSRLALKYTTASGHNICDIRAHNVMFAPQSPHFRLDLNMEQKFPPYGPCWSSTMFINKHMWIHHKTVILSLCIMRLKTSGSCLYGAHIYPSSCARFPDQFTLIRLFSSSCYAMIRRSLNSEKFEEKIIKKKI